MSDKVEQVHLCDNGKVHPENGTIITNSVFCDTCDKLHLPRLSLTEIPPSIFGLKLLTSLNLDHNNISHVSEDFCSSVKSLKVLSLTGNELTTLPQNIGSLTQLEDLCLVENLLEVLPSSLCECKNLVDLKLTGNSLRGLPGNLGELVRLRKLQIDENCLTKLPNSFEMLHKLEVLELNNNKLEVLPEGFGKLKKLRILNISHNVIKHLPSTFSLLEAIEELDVSHNGLQELPEEWKSVASLKKLYADSNQLGNIPQWFDSLLNLEDLSLRDNQLQYSAFPDKFGKVSVSLVKCDLAGNFLTSLCNSFGHLERLEYLHLGSVIDELERRNYQNGNWITHLPENFGNLVALRELHVDENQLMELPECFGDLVHLEFLDLGQNHLETLPSSFANLRSLVYCQLSKNKLRSLPESFGNLHSLLDLRLDNNQLTTLPDSFFELIQLKSLDLFNNKLTVIPMGLLNLKNLKKLDIDENDFGLPIMQVPQIFAPAKYPPRDPDLKNNWRGRPRQDLVHIENHEVQDENSSNNFAQSLMEALNNSSSLWKRDHEDQQKREKFIFSAPPLDSILPSKNERHAVSTIDDVENSVLNMNNKNTEKIKDMENSKKNDTMECEETMQEENGKCQAESESEDVESVSLNTNNESGYELDDWDSELSKDHAAECPALQETETELEDWDKELEMMAAAVDNPYEDDNTPYTHGKNQDTWPHCHEHMFVPSDNHTRPVRRTWYELPRYPNQFEDADSD